MSSTHDVTRLLVAWGEGNRAAESELIEILYVELKRLAKAYLRREHANQSLAATALVHEAYLKLVDQRNVHWQSVQESPDVNVLELDTALSRLETLEPRWSRLIELRFFAGLSVDETAAALELSPATIKRDWSLARAWLYRELRANGPAEAR